MPSLSQLLSRGQPGLADDETWGDFVRSNFEYGPSARRSIYGEGFQPNTGVDSPVTGTPQLADYVQSFGSHPEWLKKASEWDPGFFGSVRALMEGHGPEVLGSEGSAMAPTGGWTLPIGGLFAMGMRAPKMMNAGRATARNQLMDEILARSAARAQKPAY